MFKIVFFTTLWTEKWGTSNFKEAFATLYIAVYSSANQFGVENNAPNSMDSKNESYLQSIMCAWFLSLTTNLLTVFCTSQPSDESMIGRKLKRDSFNSEKRILYDVPPDWFSFTRLCQTSLKKKEKKKYPFTSDAKQKKVAYSFSFHFLSPQKTYHKARCFATFFFSFFFFSNSMPIFYFANWHTVLFHDMHDFWGWRFTIQLPQEFIERWWTSASFLSLLVQVYN